MDKSEFIKYETVREILENNNYFGFTVGRIGGNRSRLRHTFVSVKWYTIDIDVETLKFEGDNIVVGIKIDGDEIYGLENFRRRIGGIGKAHAVKRRQEVR